MRVIRVIGIFFLSILVVSCGASNEFTKKLCEIEDQTGPEFINYKEIWFYAVSKYNKQKTYNITVENCKELIDCSEVMLEQSWTKQIQTANEWKRKVENKEISEVLDEIADIPLGANFQEKRSNLIVIGQKYLEVSNLCKN
jgi:hypothetical protein